MDYHTLETLRRRHPAWRLLAADHAPLIVSFLHRSFIAPNLRSVSAPELISRLEDLLHDLRARLGEGAFPRSAAGYLEDWAADEHGWLRKYYPPNSDEPHFDLTPAAEKAIDWLASLGERHFVGTESRLLTVFELLRQMAAGTDVDPRARLAELERRKAQIDADILRIQQGHLDLMDASRVKDHFQQMATTARGLLSDFRELEQNFRELDRQVREKIATWDGNKGALLDEIFGQRDAISDSDQGKTFRAFWDFLMSPARQEELSALLQRVFALDAVQALHPDRRLLRIHYDWLEAGEIAQRTVARLSEQLRRYLDDQAWLENRRIMQLLRGVEQRALSIRESAPPGPFMALDDPVPAVELPMDRPLFAPPFKPRITDQVLLEGQEGIPADALFEQVYVDRARLAEHVRRVLQTRCQVSLAELVSERPLEQGLAELVAYLSLASEDRRAVIDDARTQTIGWTDDRGRCVQATLPTVIFTR
jgi:hypothetical protein